MKNSMMKRWLAAVLTLLMLSLLFAAGVVQASASDVEIPEVRVEEKTVHRGQTFTLQIFLDENPGLISLTLDLEYDKTVMELVGLTRGNALSSHTFTTTNTETNAGFLITPFRLLWDGRAQDLTTGVLVTLTFESKIDAAVGEYPVTVSYDKQNTNSEYGKPCDVLIQNGHVTLTKGAYTVLYLDYDGTVLYEKDCNENDVPSYVGALPARAEDAQYSYEFIGWRGVLSSDPFLICYEAEYRGTPKVYQVFFYVDGAYFRATEAAYGSLLDLSHVPSKQNHFFDGWYLDEACTQKVTAMQMPEQDLRLYGKLRFNVREDPVPEIELSLDRIEGEDVYVNVTVVQNPSLSGLVLTLDYDKNALTLAGVERGSAFASLQFDHTDTTQGYGADPFRFYWEHSSNTSETGLLLVLKFKINASASDGVYSVTMDYDPKTDATYINEDGTLWYTELNIKGARIPIGEVYRWNEEIGGVGDILVECLQGMPADTVLKIKLTTANLNLHSEQVREKFGEGKELKAAYSITLLRNGTAVQPNGMLTVKIKLTEAQMMCSELFVAYVTEGGEITLYESRVEDGYIVFETDHLSNWAIVGNVVDMINGGSGAPSEPTNSRVLILSFALLAIASMSLGLVMVARVKKGKLTVANSKKS
ncbi:MAG: hypothetical protein E7663_01990 [Ruminococcaceae bacterium]|nr:hypothetical protein [Oscillospiraceae bacterium]